MVSLFVTLLIIVQRAVTIRVAGYEEQNIQNSEAAASLGSDFSGFNVDCRAKSGESTLSIECDVLHEFPGRDQLDSDRVEKLRLHVLHDVDQAIVSSVNVAIPNASGIECLRPPQSNWSTVCSFTPPSDMADTAMDDVEAQLNAKLKAHGMNSDEHFEDSNAVGTTFALHLFQDQMLALLRRHHSGEPFPLGEEVFDVLVVSVESDQGLLDSTQRVFDWLLLELGEQECNESQEEPKLSEDPDHYDEFEKSVATFDRLQNVHMHWGRCKIITKDTVVQIRGFASAVAAMDSTNRMFRTVQGFVKAFLGEAAHAVQEIATAFTTKKEQLGNTSIQISDAAE